MTITLLKIGIAYYLYLKSNNARATFFVSNPEKLNKQQIELIKELIATGNEIGSHSYNHNNAIKYSKSNGIDNYINTDILPSIQWFDSVLNYNVKSFAYPYGARNKTLDVNLLEHFHVLRGTGYTITSNQTHLNSLDNNGLIYGLAIDNNRGYTMNDMRYPLLKCFIDQKVQVFYAHNPVKNVSRKYQINASRIDSILNFCESIGLSFYTMSELRITTPPKPMGDTVISNFIVKSSYITTYDENKTTWTIQPEDAGSIRLKNNEITIKWNRKYKGEAEVKVAGHNSCGQGSYSKPLKIRVK